jgi:superfamily I DNA and RNA helicase
MSDSFYPLVDIDFILPLIEHSDKVEGVVIFGSTRIIVLSGQKALYKRNIVLREIEPNKTTFEMATALAIRLGFMSELLKWFEKNKQWKDGGYTETVPE